jgi:uncharacterized protein
MKWFNEKIPSIFGATWEELCRQSMPILSEQWNVIFKPPGRYWEGKGFEWDLISESIDGSYLLIGEAKWTAKNPTAKWIHEMIQELKNKGIPPIFRSPKITPRYVLFVVEKPRGLVLPSDTMVIDAKDVIHVLR